MKIFSRKIFQRDPPCLQMSALNWKFPVSRSRHRLMQGFLKQLTQELIDEQNKGERLMMLIKIQDKIIGRANFQVIRGDYAEIGYRVAKSHSGQGVASWAVSELIAVAQQELSISKLIAKVTTENIASQQVLTKQGFIHAKTERSAVELNGRSHDLFVYEWLDLGLSPVIP